MKKARSSDAAKAKPLNLSKFAPSKAPANESSQDEGQTMFIRRTAATTVDKNLTEAEQETYEFGLPVKEMLGVISHCYTRGLFCSKDIAEALRDEPELRNAIGRKLPDEEAIRRFRRRYAGEIEETLEKVFRVFPNQESRPAPRPHATQTEIVRRQAADRLHEATHADNTKGHVG